MAAFDVVTHFAGRKTTSCLDWIGFSVFEGVAMVEVVASAEMGRSW